MTSAAAALPATGAAVELHYRVWHSDFRVLAPTATIAGFLERVCAQFTAAEPAADAIELEAVAGSAGWEIRRDGERPVMRKTERGVAQHLEWRMVGIAARAERRFIHWHAAALVRGERTLLLPAKSGAGKSTLALALALHGFELLGEDVVFMDPASGVIHSFPRAPHVDEGSRALLERLGMSPDPAARLGNLLAPSVLPLVAAQPLAAAVARAVRRVGRAGPRRGRADDAGGGCRRAAGPLAHAAARAAGELADPAARARPNTLPAAAAE